MEEKKQNNALKTVLFVFGVLFSIVLVPALIVGIPVGGAVTALSGAVSQDSIMATVEDVKLSETLRGILLEELEGEAQVEEFNSDYWNAILRESCSVEVMDEIIAETIDSIYNGTEADVDASGFMNSFKRGLDELAENGFDDMYSAWTEGTTSKYFSPEFVESSKTEIETSLLEEYSEYGATSLDELEKLYDTRFGAGAFAKLKDDQMKSFEEEWNNEFDASIAGEFDGMAEELETEINDVLNEAAQDPDVREVFDIVNEVSANSEKIKKIAYAIMIGAALLLLVCFWFGTAGFVVPAIPLIIGGVLCKLCAMVETVLMKFINDAIAAEPDLAEMGGTISELIKGILAPIFSEISKFGTVAIGMGVLLILLAILKGVIKKNMRVAEE